MGLPRPGHLLLLLALLLLVVAPCLGGPCPRPCRCRGRLLDCRHAALDSVPPATRHRALSVLDFTGNSISSIEKRSWREYPWAESLVLQDNVLRAVERHSLEGLLLLKHLDLSFNKILSLEEHAFEPLPFLQLINLSGNLITQIRNGTFQAWHGMQFLQKLSLSHNPLSVIADTSFFDLPSMKYLDLGATQVTQQTLLTLLLTTVRLETLKLPGDVACCFCQEKPTTETPCRTIKFHCENLCSTSAPQRACADPLAETQGEIIEAVQSRKLSTSTVLNLKPKEPSLREHETVTLAVVLSLTSTDGDLSNPHDHISRTNSYSPQQLSRQERKTSKELMLMLHSAQRMGWTSETDTRKLYFLEKALVAELKKKLHKAKIVVTVKNIVSPLPAQKQEVQEILAAEGERTRGWVKKQRDVGLSHAASNPWEAAGRLNPTDNLSVFRQRKISIPPSKHSLSHSPAEAPRLSGSCNIQNYSNTVEQTEKTPGMEEVEDVGDAEEAPSPRQDYVWTYRKHKQEDSPYLNKNNQLFSKTFGNMNPEEEPTATESKAEQRLNTKQHLFDKLLVNDSPPAASSMLEDTAEEEGSSLGGHLPAVPQTTKTHLKQQKEGSSFLNKPGSSDSLDDALVQGDLFETKVNHDLRLLIPNEALRTFITQVARALRMDCRQPELQLACAKMVSKTGLLIKLLSEGQDDQGASALMGQCLLEGKVSNGTAKETGRKFTGKLKAEYTLSDGFLLSMLVSIMIMIILTVICLLEACSQKNAAASQPRSTTKSQPRRLFQKLLPRGWSEKKDGIRAQGWRQPRDSPEGSPPPAPGWLRDPHQLLTSQQEQALAQLRDWNAPEEEEEEEEIFNRAQRR